MSSYYIILFIGNMRFGNIEVYLTNLWSITGFPEVNLCILWYVEMQCLDAISL